MTNLYVKGIFLILITAINMFFVFEAKSKNKTHKIKNAAPSYEIKNGKCRAPHKCSYDILIGTKYSKKDLTAIAYELKSLSPVVKRIFITYYLPCMEIGAGAWATSHFLPELSVNTYDAVLELLAKCAKFHKKKRNKPIKTKNTKKINVKIDLKSEFKNGKLYIKGKTNLPDKTRLLISLSKKKCDHHYFLIDANVQNRIFEGVIYNDKNEEKSLPNGKYIIKIESSLIELMDKSVQKTLGIYGENMTGKLISKWSIGGSNKVKFVSRYVITNSFDVKSDSLLLKKQLKIFKNHYNKLKKLCCGRSSLDATGLDWSVKGVEWNRERERLIADFYKKFGRTLNEYDGVCTRAKLNSSAFSHYIFTLYQHMYSKRAKHIKQWKKNIKEIILEIESDLKSCSKC